MGLLDKKKVVEPTQEESFTSEELRFILEKLRTASYIGHEFEMFYRIWVKISGELAFQEKK